MLTELEITLKELLIDLINKYFNLYHNAKEINKSDINLEKKSQIIVELMDNLHNYSCTLLNIVRTNTKNRE